MSHPRLSERGEAYLSEWSRFQDGEFEMLDVGRGHTDRVGGSIGRSMKDRFEVTTREVIVSGDDSEDDMLQEGLKDLGSNRDIGSSKSSLNDIPACRIDSGVGFYSSRVASGKDIFATAASPSHPRRLRKASAAFFQAVQSAGSQAPAPIRPPVESEDESIPQPALKEFIKARRHRRRVVTPSTREAKKRAFRELMPKNPDTSFELPRIFSAHFDKSSYSPPTEFIPGSVEAARWISRTQLQYKCKRDLYTKFEQEIQNILEACPRRFRGSRITTTRQYKRVVWLQEQIRLLSNDISAFDASSQDYLAQHKFALAAQQRQAQEDADHFTFCLSILQDHYEKYGQTSAGVDEKIARWNDGFKFLQAESPWEHPETHTWEGWVWESWDPELFRNGLDAQVEIAQVAGGDGDDMSESLVDDLGEMMSHMVIGV